MYGGGKRPLVKAFDVKRKGKLVVFYRENIIASFAKNRKSSTYPVIEINWLSGSLGNMVFYRQVDL